MRWWGWLLMIAVNVVVTVLTMWAVGWVVARQR